MKLVQTAGAIACSFRTLPRFKLLRPPTVAEPGKGAGLEVENLLAEIHAIVADTNKAIRKAG